MLLSYSDNENIDSIVSNKMLERSEYEFTTTNKVSHKLWKIDDEQIINKIVSEFKNIEDIYKTLAHEVFHHCFSIMDEDEYMDEMSEETLIFNLQWAEFSLA